MHEGSPVLNIKNWGNGASTTRLYIFVECASFLQSLFQQNKTNVSFRESARFIARNYKLQISAYVRRIHPCVICANNPALEDQNHY